MSKIPDTVPDKGMYKTIMNSFKFLKEENYRYDPVKKDIVPVDKNGNVIEVKRGRKKKTL
jgi:hypothetical protein